MTGIDINTLRQHKTPFYYYDKALLERTLDAVEECIAGKPVKMHYAVKANANPELLRIIASRGFGADCVSGNEITRALECGFSPEGIFYAGVGKTDEEILTGIESGIGCFNIESVEEIDILGSLAAQCGKEVSVALRVNPNIDAHTHEYITTGLKENKFGIDLTLLDEAVEKVRSTTHLRLEGLHFHIGSQITTNEPFRILGERINGLAEHFRKKGVKFKFFDVGGGLGIDYDDPDLNPVPDFKGYFGTLLESIHLEPGQEIHCELGRSIVAQCGSLIAGVTLVKKGLEKNFIIVDAGMSDLLRPALYGAHHKIENISAEGKQADRRYDVVGPICESSDVFGKDELLPETRRGDLIAFRSAGAYGESMANNYNLRKLPGYLIG